MCEHSLTLEEREGGITAADSEDEDADEDADEGQLDAGDFTWGGSLHTSFRLLPEPLGHLRPFLTSNGKTREAVLEALPYDRARAGPGAGERPSAKRYRDARQIYQSAGLIYDERDGDQVRLRVTPLGRTVLELVPILNSANAVILGRHAAYALAACQLRNPLSRTARRFDDSVTAFPCSYIWRAMLALENRISSEELNRAVFFTRDEDELEAAIRRIDEWRRSGSGNPSDLSVAEAVTGARKNDRIIPWMSLASFGWTLFSDKRGGEEAGYYEIPGGIVPLLRSAAQIRHKPRKFDSTKEYVLHLSSSAALPTDMR